MRAFICLLAILWLCHSDAQTIKPLAIGDKVPDWVVNHFINAPFSSSRLPFAKNKIILLDFFATWCGPCVAMLPRLDSLDKQMGDTLQVFVVGYEKAATIQTFLANKTKNLQLPFITGDTIFRQWFPHKLIPHEVWIKDGIVSAISHAESVTADNIRRLAINGNPAIRQKNDLFHFDRDKPLLENEVVNYTTIPIHSSVLLPHIEGLSGMSDFNRDTVRKLQRMYFINLPLTALYRQAIHDSIPVNRWILNTSLKESFSKPIIRNTEWTIKHTYCYEQTAPLNTSLGKMKSKMLTDLNEQFSLAASIEQKWIDAWIIRADTTPLISATALVPGEKIALAALIKKLNKDEIGAPVFVDATKTMRWITSPDAAVLNNIPSLQAFLHTNGLTISRELVMMPVFVLADISKPFK